MAYGGEGFFVLVRARQGRDVHRFESEYSKNKKGNVPNLTEVFLSL